MPQSSAKERPTAENSDVLNRNFDLSVIDHIGQLVAESVQGQRSQRYYCACRREAWGRG